jgi:Flp pilus assembly protein TadG
MKLWERMDEGPNRRRGAAMLTVVIALMALLAASSLAVDVGLVWAARTQLQNAVDAAALAAAANMIDFSDPANPVVTAGAAEAAAIGQAGLNETASTNSVNVVGSAVVLGNWDLDARTFDSSVNLSNPSEVTAVEVTAALDGSSNTAVPALLSRVLGRSSFTVTSDATAYLGWAGNSGPATVALPIAIDCCKLKGGSCEDEYCSGGDVNTPPNECDLANPQDEGANTVSCLEFSATGDQNACWTVFDDSSPSIGASAMIDIVESGNEFEVSVGTKYYMDNGDKTPVIQEIADRFYGNPPYKEPAGSDIYLPKHTPPQADSWVIKLPVIECQTDDKCAGGEGAELRGFVCFEVREVVSTPDKIIRGRFLCPSEEIATECYSSGSGSGGIDVGIRAGTAVLVR